MDRYQISGISGIDTRKLARSIRDKGSRRCLITAADTPRESGLEKIRSAHIANDAVPRVSCGKIWQAAATDHQFHVVAYDCGMKLNIVRSLNARGCDVTIVPWNTPAEHIEELRPDVVFLSNGPGDPTDVPPVIDTIHQLRGKYPMFGICLGHQLLALAYGAETYKLKFGHRGGNHPVKDLRTGRIEITSQNHSYAVNAGSLQDTPLKCTHINLLDNMVCTPSSRQRNHLHFTHENPSCIPYGAGCYAASRRSWTSIGVRTPRPRWRRRKL